jgi:hypothetical protein
VDLLLLVDLLDRQHQ